MTKPPGAPSAPPAETEDKGPSEQTPPTPPVAKQQEQQHPKAPFPREELLEHIKDVIDGLGKHIGVKGRNPFLFTKNVIDPLLKRLNGYKDEAGTVVKPEESEALYKAIKALDPEHDPIVTNVDPETKPAHQSLVMTNKGIVTKEEAARTNAAVITPNIGNK
jgi:hypothetical protein